MAEPIAPQVPGRWRFRLGRLAVIVWPGFVAFVVLVAAAAVWIGVYADHGSNRVLGWGMLGGLLVALPVHEAAHSLTARARGHQTVAVVLRGLGMAVHVDRTGMTRRDHTLMLIAGPASDLAVALGFAALSVLAFWLAVPQALVAALLGASLGALVLMALNLMPVPPADMGRLLATRRAEPRS